MSLLRRIWSFIRSPTGFVGRDLEGNKFYEYPSTSIDPRRTRRVVKYQGKRDLLAYATEGKQLSAQWRAWLSHTRKHAPTLQDLERDIARQRQIMHNVAIIEARDNEERRRQIDVGSSIAFDSEDSKVEDPSKSPTPKPSTTSSTQPQWSPWIPQSENYEPQSWSPRSSKRG